MAPERTKRPDDITKKRKSRKLSPVKRCPFEDLKKTGNWPPTIEYKEKGEWQVVAIPNKYPAFTPVHGKPVESELGLHDFLYHLTEGVGYHELVVTRSHSRDFPKLPPTHAFQVFKIFTDRYKSIDRDKYMAYLSIFGNWGPTSGASISHPHYQLMAMPVIPPDVAQSYEGSRKYFKRYKRCIHCAMLKFEMKEGKRVVAENPKAVAIAPFVSHKPYEVRIFPKKHFFAFELSPEAVLKDAAELLQKVLGRMKARLNDPDYNFYIHTAPLHEHEKYDHYHWHIEITPKIGLPGGFELATGMDVNVVEPEATAKLLK